MEKLIIMQKQLLFLHAELRKVKSFHKESGKNFKNFYSNMSSSFRILNKGNIFNEIQFLNILNLNIIEFFNNQILKQSHAHSQIHRKLKEEGNKLKQFEKELEKRMKAIQAATKKRENQLLANETFELSEMKAKEVQIIDINKEVDATLKELSLIFTLIRENIQKSFDEYIETLCTFSETKTQIKLLHSRTEENYKDSSPIFEKKFDLLMNLNQGSLFKTREETHYSLANSKVLQEASQRQRRIKGRSEYSDNNIHYNMNKCPQDESHVQNSQRVQTNNPTEIYEVEYLNEVVEDDNIQNETYNSKFEFKNPGTFYTPNKSNVHKPSSNSNFKENTDPSYILKTNSSNLQGRNYSGFYEDEPKQRQNNSELKENRNKMVNNYLQGKSRTQVYEGQQY